MGEGRDEVPPATLRQGDIDLLIFPCETYLVSQGYVLPIRNMEMGQALRTWTGNPAATLPNLGAAQGACRGISSHRPFFGSLYWMDSLSGEVTIPSSCGI